MVMAILMTTLLLLLIEKSTSIREEPIIPISPPIYEKEAMITEENIEMVNDSMNEIVNVIYLKIPCGPPNKGLHCKGDSSWDNYSNKQKGDLI